MKPLPVRYNQAMNRDPRVDAYLRKARPFARPILRRIRSVIRANVRGGVETMKWGMPAYTRNGRIVCGMAAFQAHCAWWFWNSAKLRRAGLVTRRTGQGAMGQFGRITSIKDLPPRTAMIRVLRAAVAINARSGR